MAFSAPRTTEVVLEWEGLQEGIAVDVAEYTCEKYSSAQPGARLGRGQGEVVQLRTANQEYPSEILARTVKLAQSSFHRRVRRGIRALPTENQLCCPAAAWKSDTSKPAREMTRFRRPGKGRNFGGIDSHVFRPMITTLVDEPGGTDAADDSGCGGRPECVVTVLAL